LFPPGSQETVMFNHPHISSGQRDLARHCVPCSGSHGMAAGPGGSRDTT
jgi:hypothetical protein